MAIKITGKFEPTNVNTDIYPITDSTYNLGGHHEVLTINERNLIPNLRRREGMTCYVAESAITYQLQYGIDNTNWVIFGANIISNVDNGLTNTNGTIKLGGILNEHTTISSLSYDLTINNMNSTLKITDDTVKIENLNGMIINTFEVNNDIISLTSLETDFNRHSSVKIDSAKGVIFESRTLIDNIYSRFIMDSQSIKITNNNNIFSGITYDKNYSKNYTLRTLPDVEYVNKKLTEILKYTLQQTDSQIMWGGDAQIWTDGDENPIIFENKSTDEHIVDLYNNIINLDDDVKTIGEIYNFTYTELEMMKNNNLLIPGRKYAIIDFRTIHTIPHTTDINTGPIETIVVEAKTSNTFNIQASSLDFPQDTIYYDFNSNITEDGTTSRPGKITFRKDNNKNISTYYDFRQVKFRRWRIVPIIFNSSTTYSKNFLVQDSGDYYVSVRDSNIGHSFSDDNWWIKLNNKNFYIWQSTIPSNFGNLNPLSWVIQDVGNRNTFANINNVSNVEIGPCDEIYNNIVFLGNYVHDVIFYNSKNITTYDFYENGTITNMYNNSFMNVHSSIFGPDNHDNIFTHIYYSNLNTFIKENFVNYMVSSNIGVGFYNNTIYSMQNFKSDSNFRWNITNNMVNVTAHKSTDNNLFIGQMSEVTFENAQSNEFADFKSVTFGETCRNNKMIGFEYTTFGDNCYDNTIDGPRHTYSRQYNRIGNNFNNNNFNNHFTNNVIVGEFYRNTGTGSFSYNDLENHIYNDNTFTDFSDNKCTDNIANNTFGATVSNNIFAYFNGNNVTYFQHNDLTKSIFQGNSNINYFNYNKISNTFQSNTIGDNFNYNIIETPFNTITTNNHFQYNTIKYPIYNVDYSSSTHVYGDYNCEILKGNGSNIFLTYIDDTTSTQQIVSHTA